MAKSAPARHLRTKFSTSVSWSGERGCFSGKAATPTQKSPELRMSRTSSSAYSRPWACRTQSACGSPGGSPRSASTLRTPAAAKEPMIRRSSATLWSTAVRWASGVSVVSVAMRSVMATVRSRVDPPAP